MYVEITHVSDIPINALRERLKVCIYFIERFVLLCPLFGVFFIGGSTVCICCVQW